MKIGLKLVVIITAVNLICISGLTVTSLVITSNQVGAMANDNAITLTGVTANQIKAFLEVPLDEIRAMAILLSNIEKAVPPEARRDIVNFTLLSLINAKPEYVGVWAVFEPNALDGMDAVYANTPGTDATGRYISYYTHGKGGIEVEALIGYDDPGSNGAYYNNSFRSGKEAIVEPYFYEINGKETLITSVTVPVTRNGRLIGVAGVDLELTEIQALVNAIKPFGVGLSGLFSNTGMIISHPDPARLGKNAQDTEQGLAGARLGDMMKAIKNGDDFCVPVYSTEMKSNMTIVLFPLTIGGSATTWSVASIVPESVIMGPVYRMIRISIILGIVILAIITVIILIVARSITAPLKSMEKVFGYVGEGDFTNVLDAGGNDEIGNISRHFNVTMDKIRKLVTSIKNEATNLSDVGNDLAANMSQTAAGVNEIAANVHSIKGRVLNQSASVTETHATMEQLVTNINKLNDNVEDQSNNMAHASSAIEEMVANIRSVTTTLVNNADNVRTLKEASEVGRTGLQEVVVDIQEIARESEGLLEINSVMENIASQTNLLSMNAAIEAAHAGEAGKGFAVVADEIRKLAENSSEQSKTISQVLKKMKTSIDKITSSTDNVLNKFEAIDLNVRTVADQEENIRNAMEEQGAGSKQILESVSNVNDLTRQVKSGSNEMLSGAKEVINESKNLDNVTQEISSGMNEMDTGAEQINKAVNDVKELSQKNREGISVLIKNIAHFKVE